MKALKHIVNWIVWSLMAITLAAMTLIRVPAVQTWLGRRVAHELSQVLGTRVSVGRVDLGLFNRVIVDSILLHDQQGAPLLQVGRMSARMELYPLTEGRIVLTSAQLFGAHASLCRDDAQSPLNCQFLIDALASPDTTSHTTPLHLRINSLIIRQSSVSYHQADAKQTPEQFNAHHLSFSNISAHILLRELTDSSLDVTVRRLSFAEQSGLDVRRLSFAFTADSRMARLSRFYLQLPRSDISIPEITARGSLLHDVRHMSWNGSVADASIHPRDLVPLLPALSHFRSPVSLSAAFDGTPGQIALRQLHLHTADGELRADLSGWADPARLSQWQAHVATLYVAAPMIATLHTLLPSLPEVLTRLGTVSLQGDYGRRADGLLTADGTLATDRGTVSLQATVTADTLYRGHLQTAHADLGQLLAADDLGSLAATIDFHGTPRQLTAKGTISQMEYRGHAYQQIALDATATPSAVDARIAIDDPHLSATIEGRLTTTKPYAARLQATVGRLAPKALNIADRWGDAVFSGLIDADISGTTMHDAQGTLTLADFAMRDTTLLYKCDKLQLVTGYDAGMHYFRLQGDMGRADLSGHFDWATLPQSCAALLAATMPTLPGLPPAAATPPDNDFTMQLHLDDATWLRQLLGVDISISQPAIVSATIDDHRRRMTVAGHLPYVSYNGSTYKDVALHISNPADTMRCDARLTRLSDSGKHIDLHLGAFAAHNELQTTLDWDNHSTAAAMSGRLSTLTQLYRNESGQPEAHMRILPSHTVMGDAQWIIAPSDIVYSSGRLLVDHFSVAHADQHILIDGIASKEPTDTLTVDLNRVEVPYVLELVDFTAVTFGGEASGTACITSAFGVPDAWAQLRVDHFTFEGGRMGTLQAHAAWNRRDEQIDIRATANDGPSATTIIDGFVSPGRDCIDLSIRGRGTYIDFLGTFTESFLSHVQGNTWGDVRLVGPLGQMDLLGQLVVDGSATVTSLGTTYTLSKDTVTFVPNDILIDRQTISDRHNNTATLHGAIHHDHLTGMTFDLDVSTDKVLAYDVPPTTDEPFYGTVLASGSVDMHGRPGEVVINCNATPLGGTVFTYNVANPDAISDQKFITWHDADADTTLHASAPKTDATQAPDAAADVPTDLYINFLLSVTDDATLRLLMDAKTADYITLAGQGVIRAAYHNKGAFQMFGNYNVERGTYGITIQNIIKKNFTFQPGGTIVFGGDPMDASLQLQAQHTVNGVSLSDLSIGHSLSSTTVRVNCLMNIVGQAKAPRVEFDLDMPSVNTEEKQMIRSVIASEQEMNQQVLSLLSIGRFYTQGVNNAASQRQYDQTQLAMQSFLSGTMSTQINELLSQVLKTDNWNFGANISTGNEGWHNAEYEGIVSGQMLNNRLLINGQFGYRDNATQQTPSFIGDFDIRYLLRPGGNLALKVYNQSNDRYFTRSSLNTQGIGLIIKRDFNGLYDLLHPRRNSKTDSIAAGR